MNVYDNEKIGFFVGDVKLFDIYIEECLGSII